MALRVNDIEATIAWYTEFTPLELLDKREDEMGFGAWLGMPDTVERPFILVVAQFAEGCDPFDDAPHAVLAPFAHFGIEVPTAAERSMPSRRRPKQPAASACHPRKMPPPIGYITMLKDPDGNMIEYSWDQGVYATALERWGTPVSPRPELLARFSFSRDFRHD